MNLLVLVKTMLRHKANEKMSREQLKQKQLAQFRKFIRYVQKHSPYYAQLIKDREINPHTCMPEHFPVLTKYELMKHFDQIVTDPAITKAELAAFFRNSKNPKELFKRKYYAVHSSGTSGQPTFFVYSQADWARGMAHNHRLKNIRLKKQRLAFYGMTGGHYAGVTFAHTATKSIFQLLYDVKTFHVMEPLDEIVEQLNVFYPDILMGYPTSIRKLAARQAAGDLRIHPRTVQVSGEMLSATDKAFIERTFDTKVLNVYSCSDHTIMGIAHPEYEGMYLMEDDLIFELESDRMLVTNMFNYTLPLIRYEMNDVLTEQMDDAEKVLPFIKIQDIIGRTENAPVFLNQFGKKDTISQHLLGELFVEHVIGLQIKVTGPESFHAYCIIEERLDKEKSDAVFHELSLALRHLLTANNMDNVQFSLESIPELIIDPVTGKHQLLLA